MSDAFQMFAGGGALFFLICAGIALVVWASSKIE